MKLKCARKKGKKKKIYTKTIHCIVMKEKKVLLKAEEEIKLAKTEVSYFN